MRLSLAAFIVLVLAGLAPARAQILQHKDLSLDVAKTIADGAIGECRRRGYATTVVIVDRAGETMLMMRDDNTGPHTVENARRKAYTALTFKVTSKEYAGRFEAGNPVTKQQATLPGIIAIPGGVPIKVGSETIGAVGMSGSPGVDEDCVLAGLGKAADALK